MAKIKVHELAKQIGADRKAVVDYLHTKGYDTMTAVSAVPDNEVDNIRSRFGGSSQEPFCCGGSGPDHLQLERSGCAVSDGLCRGISRHEDHFHE